MLSTQILRPYQTEALAAVHNEWGKLRSTLVVAATGTGKTIMFLALLDQLRREERLTRALVLVHKIDLTTQPLEKASRFFSDLSFGMGIVQAARNDVAARVIVSTVQSLTPRRLELIRANGPISHIIVDECFPSGTLVNGRPIETIAVGDTVTAWDEETCTFVPGKVTRTFKRPAPSGMVRVFTDFGELVCTSTHPIFTDCGWQMAINLRPNDTLFFSGDDYAETRNPLFDLRKEVLSDGMDLAKVSEAGLGHMLGGMQSGANAENFVRDYGAHEPALCQRAYAAQQSDVQAGSESKDASHAEGARLGNGETRREWGTDTAANRLGKGAELANRSVHFDGASAGLSERIQGGHWEPGTEDRVGSGRANAQIESASTGGRQENRLAQYARVDHIEILELGSGRESNAVCPDGFVYNLEVEHYHTYTANGFAVHNCHHAVAKTYRDILAQFPEAKVVGWTATPVRADERGLRGVFESVAYRLPIRRAISEGALVKPVIMGFGIGGDLATAFEADNFLELVLDKWHAHAAGRRTVAFTSTIAQAHQTADYFRGHGVPAAAISGETPKRERESVRQALVAGELKLVANAQVWTEGTDIPEIAAMLILRQYKPHDGPFIQMVGRGLRPAEGKSDCVILDFNPAQGRNFNLEGDLLGDSIELDAAEADKVEEPTEDEALEALQQLSLGFTVDPARLTTLVMDYLKFDALAWVSHADCHWMSNINRDVSLWIVGPDGTRLAKAQALQGGPSWTAAMERAYQHIRRYRVYLAENGYNDAEVSHLGTFNDFEQAKQAGDDYALDHLENILANRSAKWRSDPASEAQIRVLRGMGRRSREALTKGEAASLISWKKGFGSVQAFDHTAAPRYQPMIEHAEVIHA